MVGAAQDRSAAADEIRVVQEIGAGEGPQADRRVSTLCRGFRAGGESVDVRRVVARVRCRRYSIAQWRHLFIEGKRV